MSEINITELQKLQPFLRTWLKKVGLISLEYLKLSQKNISLVIAGDKAMRGLNKKYRNKDQTTDVLSFGELFNRTWVGKIEENFLGEIIVNLPQATRQAKLFSLPLKEELSRLLIHGILHLNDLDHEKSKKEEKKMLDLQEKILKYVASA